MASKYHDADEGNRCYQRGMAQALVAGFGHDAAVEICVLNGWQGVTKVLLPPRGRTRSTRSGEGGPSASDRENISK